MRRFTAAIALATILLGLAAGRPTWARAVAAHAPAKGLPWIADDYPRAVALAKQRHLPIFVENWAPW